MERLGDLRESFVEVLVVPRVQDSFAAGFDSNGAVAVELTSKVQWEPSGSVETRAHSIGSMNEASLFCTATECIRVGFTLIEYTVTAVGSGMRHTARG